ncbi:MAG: aromatic amino acid lyase [Hyphomicrobiaceae bacterium]
MRSAEPAADIALNAVRSPMKRGLQFLSQLSDLDLDWLLSAGYPEEIAAGHRLIKKGDERSDLILILDGEVSVHDDDTEREIAVLDEGELLGEVSFIDRRGATASATTTRATRIFRLSNERLSEKLKRDPVFGGRFYAMVAGFLSGRLRDVLTQAEAEQPNQQELVNNEAVGSARLGRLLRRLNPDAPVCIAGQDLTIEDVVKVAHDGNKVVVSTDTEQCLEASRQVVERLATSDRPIYGLNTGLGALSEERIASNDFAEYQRKILLSHAAGSPPDFADEVVRAIMLARLNGMARGGAGISPAVFRQLMQLLNEGIIPVVPGRGSVGMSDLAPLAHMSLPLIGEGEVRYRGRRMPAGEALQLAGMAPVELGAKDGLSLVSANSAAVGHGVLVLARCIELLAHADIAAALSIEAFGANPSPLDERLLPVRPHQGQVMATTKLRSLLMRAASAPGRSVRNLQDPISFRCVPQVHGPSQEVLANVRRVVELELNSTGDNPVVLPEAGEIVSNGNFHPAGIALAFETLGLSLSQICSLSTNRTLRLNDASMTDLPDQLIAQPGLNTGLGILQKTVTMLNAQVRFLAGPASLDVMAVAGSIEDHSTMATFVVAKCEEQVEAAERIVAIELLTAAQAIDLRGRPQLGIGTDAAFEIIRQHVDVMVEDRLVSDDVEKLFDLVRGGMITRAVGAAIETEEHSFAE